MKTQLEEFIRKKTKNPKQEEIAEILDCFELQTFPKGHYFKEPFTQSKELGFLIEGSIRVVIFKKNGDEITGRILQENSFATDLYSIRNDEITPIGIQCMSNVTMLVAPYPRITELLETNLALNITFREYMADTALEVGRNYLLFITGTAKDRYKFILENKPSLLQQFPLRLIASMIGVTPTQLSRIRNKKT